MDPEVATGYCETVLTGSLLRSVCKKVLNLMFDIRHLSKKRKSATVSERTAREDLFSSKTTPHSKTKIDRNVPYSKQLCFPNSDPKPQQSVARLTFYLQCP